MKVHTNKLDINKFKEDFETLYSRYEDGDAEQVLDTIVVLINESDCSIRSFLKSVDNIDGEEIQKYCRHAAIAQMYNAGLEYNRCRYRYVDTSPYGEAVMIKLPNSTVVLSKYGDILINEGEIWTHSGLNYGRGWITHKIGQLSKKYGFIDNKGARVLPCVFDYIKGHIGSMEIYFSYFEFSLRNFGKVDSVNREMLQEILDYYNPNNIYCLSEDSILFELMPFGYKSDELMEEDELIEELKSELSSILITKEKLQEIVESKTE